MLPLTLKGAGVNGTSDTGLCLRRNLHPANAQWSKHSEDHGKPVGKEESQNGNV